MINSIEKYLLQLQENIAQTLTELDGKAKFIRDHWQGKNNSTGHTWVIENGNIFEKGAINFSHVCGSSLPQAATIKRPELAGKAFEALGVSLIMHPCNPFVPTTHLNVRFFSARGDNNQQPIWWFGGGYDLTPYYGFVEDCQHWHRTAKQACDPFGEDVYLRFKKWCDDYFYIKHRQEPRGIGGLFFDDLNEWDFEHCFDFMRAIGDSFLPAYSPIVAKRKSHPFNAKHKDFQRYRQGRYVEFNLVYDRGTLFGLQYGGRVESILCSLPPHVMWGYQWQPRANSIEAELYEKFLQVRDWLS